MLSNISAFIWAVLSHWQSYLTGGVVTAVIGLIERFSNWKMPRKWYAILFVGVFLLVSFFLAWRDQYQIAQTVPGLEQKVKDQDQIIQGLKERPPQINMPPAIVNIPSVSAPPATRHAPPVPQPRGLTELQRTILMSDLKEGIGLKVRINSVGKLQDTLDFADELQSVFKGWQIERNMVGALLTNVGTSTSELEFAIPQPQDRAVQIAIHAFDHAHIQYTKNVDPYAYRGAGAPGEQPPALTINIRDR